MHPDKIKSRRSTRIDDKTKLLLKQSFAHIPNPNKDTRQKLSDQLGLSEAKVSNWFQSERARIKKSKHPLSAKSKFICECMYFVHFCV